MNMIIVLQKREGRKGGCRRESGGTYQTSKGIKGERREERGERREERGERREEGGERREEEEGGFRLCSLTVTENRTVEPPCIGVGGEGGGACGGVSGYGNITSLSLSHPLQRVRIHFPASNSNPPPPIGQYWWNVTSGRSGV